MVAPMTMPEPWWSCCCLPGRHKKSGSSDSATFMRKVPEPDLRPLKRAASSGSTAPSGTRSRNSSFGGTLAATVRAAMRSPDASRTPATLPSSMMRPATGASRRMPAPRVCAASAMALVMAPMPPTAWPHTPLLPLTSPKQWCSST